MVLLLPTTLVLIFCALFSSSGNATVRDAVNSDGLELNCEATKKKNSEKKKTAAHSHCEKPSFFVRKVNFCETLLGHFVAVCLHFQLFVYTLSSFSALCFPFITK